MSKPNRTYEEFGIEGVVLDCSYEQRVLCPKCSHTRKKSMRRDLAVNTDKAAWYCHHCGLSGSLLSGWEGELSYTFSNNSDVAGNKKANYTQKDSKSNIAAQVLPCLYKITGGNTLRDSDIEWFETVRGITIDTLIENNILVDINKYIPNVGKTLAYGFPYYDKTITEKGLKLVNIKWRTPNKDFCSEKGCGRYMYRWFSLYDYNGSPVKSFIITEGEFDALSAVEAGFDAVTSVPDGAPQLNAKNLQSKFECLNQIKDVYSNADRIIIAVDNDEPGRFLQENLIKIFGVDKSFIVSYPEDCKDLNDVLVKYGKDTVKDVICNATPIPIKGITTANEIKLDVENFYNSGADKGVSTGWREFDKYYTVKTGEMNIVTGIPSHGKSSFVDAMLVNIAKSSEWSFAVFSPENYPLKRHIKKYIELYCGLPFFGGPGKRLQPALLPNYIDWVDKHFYFIGSTPDSDEELNLDNILSKIAVCINRYNIKGFVIDPWNEIDHNRPAKYSETEYISMCLTKIRRFARSYNVVAFIIAHPAKQHKTSNGTYLMPSAYDISGSANWRNKADNILCVYRPDMSKSDCIVAVQKIKFKEIGQVGEITFNYNTENGRYDILKTPVNSTNADKAVN